MCLVEADVTRKENQNPITTSSSPSAPSLILEDYQNLIEGRENLYITSTDGISILIPRVST
jgi:hypothetical protein